MNRLIDITVNGDKAKWDITHPLLTNGSANYKIAKSEKFKGGKYSTMILHLAPSTISGYNTCPHASEGCKAICLNQAGHGGCNKNRKLVSNTTHIARVGRTTLLHTNKKFFFKKLKLEINQFLMNCTIKESLPCIRLNGTSDLNWAKIKDPETKKNLMELFPEIQFYDYTKDINQLKNVPKNYYFSFSRSENNHLDVAKALSMGVNIAVVFDKKMGLPDTYMGYPVFDADQTDLRFLDNELSKHKKPIVIGLLEKGYLAKHDKTGFVIRESDLMKAVA
jgi:hypothetical protein